MQASKLPKLPGNYITNLSLQNASGGWNGMNAALYAELARHFDLDYVGPINPPTRLIERIWAKLLKGLQRPQPFYFFSEYRLNRIAGEVASQRSQQAAFDYFHGITPWIETKLSLPTFAYTDACFATYCDTYHRSDVLSWRDLDRIVMHEKHWLQEVTRAYFSSQYALEECRQRYQLPGDNFECVGVGANIATPVQDRYMDGYRLIFIAVDFARKGGSVATEAFVRFRQKFGEATLTFVGAQPPASVLDLPGVTWAGFLSKEVPDQLQRLQDLFSTAFALVLPTVSDMTPLVVAEAALHGCPTLAPRAFGLPEMIRDGQTGRLLSNPPDASEFALALQAWADNPAKYLQTRQAARTHALENFTWTMVGKRIAQSISYLMDRK